MVENQNPSLEFLEGTWGQGNAIIIIIKIIGNLDQINCFALYSEKTSDHRRRRKRKNNSQRSTQKKCGDKSGNGNLVASGRKMLMEERKKKLLFPLELNICQIRYITAAHLLGLTLANLQPWYKRICSWEGWMDEQHLLWNTRTLKALDHENRQESNGIQLVFPPRTNFSLCGKCSWIAELKNPVLNMLKSLWHGV